MIDKNRIYKDQKVKPGERMGETKALRIPTSEGLLVGYALTPNSMEGQRHPVILMLHGFPGICNNHDLAQLFRNAGFTVFVPNAPGAWGSGGVYSFDGIVRAAREVADFIVKPETCEEFRIDPKKFFLFGHSMGGFTAINLARKCDLFLGQIFAAPCDLHWYFEHPENGLIERLPESAEPFLKTAGNLSENARKIHESMAFAEAFEELKDKNICLIRCEKDKAIPKESLAEFEAKMTDDSLGKGLHSLKVLDTDHGFNDSKFEVAETVIDFCKALLREEN